MRVASPGAAPNSIAVSPAEAGPSSGVTRLDKPPTPRLRRRLRGPQSGARRPRRAPRFHRSCLERTRRAQENTAGPVAVTCRPMRPPDPRASHDCPAPSPTVPKSSFGAGAQWANTASPTTTPSVVSSLSLTNHNLLPRVCGPPSFAFTPLLRLSGPASLRAPIALADT